MSNARRLEEQRAHVRIALPIVKRMIEVMDHQPRAPDAVREFRGLAWQLMEILKDVDPHTVIPMEYLGVFTEDLRATRGLLEAARDDDVRKYAARLLPGLEAALARGASAPDPLFANVANDELRLILTRDLEEAHDSLAKGLYKSCMVLCGSILEAALYEILRRNPTWTMSQRGVPGKPGGGGPKNINSTAKEDGWMLGDLIRFCGETSILEKTDIDHLNRALRDPRDLIHPMAELRNQTTVSPDQAALSYHALRVVLDRLARKTMLP